MSSHPVLVCPRKDEDILFYRKVVRDGQIEVVNVVGCSSGTRGTKGSGTKGDATRKCLEHERAKRGLQKHVIYEGVQTCESCHKKRNLPSTQVMRMNLCPHCEKREEKDAAHRGCPRPSSTRQPSRTMELYTALKNNRSTPKVTHKPPNTHVRVNFKDCIGTGAAWAVRSPGELAASCRDGLTHGCVTHEQCRRRVKKCHCGSCEAAKKVLKRRQLQVKVKY